MVIIIKVDVIDGVVVRVEVGQVVVVLYSRILCHDRIAYHLRSRGSLHEFFLFSQIRKERVLQTLFAVESIVRVVREHFFDDVHTLRRRVFDQRRNASSWFISDFVEFNALISSIFLEFFQQFLRRRSKDIVDLIDLVQFVLAREKRKQRENLEHDATYAPDVHFIAIESVR